MMTPQPCATSNSVRRTRRAFLRDAAVYGSAVALSSIVTQTNQPQSNGAQVILDSSAIPRQIGLGLYTVRDLMTDSTAYRAVLAKVAEIGYKEIEPADRTDAKGVEVDDGIWLMTFMDYDLGYIDLEEKTLQPLNNPFWPNGVKYVFGLYTNPELLQCGLFRELSGFIR
jgi:hypothetical protein